MVFLWIIGSNLCKEKFHFSGFCEIMHFVISQSSFSTWHNVCLCNWEIPGETKPKLIIATKIDGVFVGDSETLNLLHGLKALEVSCQTLMTYVPKPLRILSLSSIIERKLSWFLNTRGATTSI